MKNHAENPPTFSTPRKQTPPTMEASGQRVKISNEGSRDSGVHVEVLLPPNGGLYLAYEEIYFHLMQTAGLGTALRQSYGEITVDAEYRFRFLNETTEQRYISWVGEQLFSQRGSDYLNAEMRAIRDAYQTNLPGCIFFASLMPKYCEYYRTHGGKYDEDKIIRSFIAEIKSLRLPSDCLWTILMRKYYECYQKLHGESPKDFYLMWMEEDEMVEASLAKTRTLFRELVSISREQTFFQLRD